jgi:nucleoside-diphosphate-sugar epimerase
MRISAGELSARRRQRPGRILITGATGFLGSHLAVRLLRDGNDTVWLARPGSGTTAADRVRRLLDWFGVDAGLRKNVRVVEAEITRPGLGLEPPAWAELSKGIDEIVHCASDTSFPERKRPTVELVNIEGLRHVLDLAVRGSCDFFHLLSTAYVAGRRSGVCREELVRPAAFTNVYEEIKCRAEGIADEASRKSGIRLAVYRPSIVYGDSRTGRSLLFSALYYPVRTVAFLRDVFAADIRERGGKRAAAAGVRLENDGRLYLPLRMEVENGGGLDLVPVDYFVDAFAALREESLDGGVFHIVSGRRARLADIAAYGERFLGIRGVEVCSQRDLTRRPANDLEVLFDRYIESYRPYLRDERTFAVDRARPILEKRGITCPQMDYDIFARCMAYAVACGWGARLFPT